MRELSLSELKSAELAILRDVADFCDRNDIRYYLGGGTLLGAVRHKGFIPWDDDIDINMPRPDYQRFVQLYNGSNPHYFVKSVENDGSYIYTNARVYDNRTYLRNFLIRKPQPYEGVSIDIFPIDGLPDGEKNQRKVFREQEILIILANGSSMRYMFSHKYLDSADKGAKIKGIVRTLLKFGAISLFRFLPTEKLVRMINTNLERFPYETSEEIACLVACIHGADCERMKKSEYEPRRYFDFEGYKFQGPVGYDIYLKNLYGDYMNLPPESRRITHHDFSAYWKEKE